MANGGGPAFPPGSTGPSPAFSTGHSRISAFSRRARSRVNHRRRPLRHFGGACVGAPGMGPPRGKRRAPGDGTLPAMSDAMGCAVNAGYQSSFAARKSGYTGMRPIYPAICKPSTDAAAHRARFILHKDISFLRPKKLILDPQAGLLARGHCVARLLGIIQWHCAHHSPTQQRSCRGFSPRSLLIRRQPEPADFPIFCFHRISYHIFYPL